MKKILIPLFVLLVILSAFTACFSKQSSDTTAALPETTAGKPDNTSVTPLPSTSLPITSETEYVRVTREERLAIDYITALLNKEYDTAIALFDLPESGASLVFAEDVEWALPRTEYKDLSYFDPSSAEFTTTPGYGGIVTIDVRDGKGEHQTFSVKTTIPDDGDGTPKIDGENVFYFKSCKIRVPGNVKISINGIEIGSDMLKERRVGKWALESEFLFPAIGAKDKTVRVWCDNFDAEKVFTPVGHNENAKEGDDNMIRFLPQIKEESGEELRETIKTLWNDMYAVYKAEGSTATDLNQFIASEAAVGTANTIYDAFGGIASYYKNVRITQVVAREGSGAAWFNDHVVCVNFNYKIEWETYGSADKGLRSSAIFLTFEDGSWKIYQVPYSEFFSKTYGSGWD